MNKLTKSEVAELIRELIPYIKNPVYIAPKGCFKGQQDTHPGKIIEYDATLMPYPPQVISQTENLKLLIDLYKYVNDEDLEPGNIDGLTGGQPEETTIHELPFNIISVFKPADRLEELDKIPTIDGYTDYWTAAKLLCEKDGGHLATCEELAQIASEIYENKDGTPVIIAKDEDVQDLRVKDKYKDNPPINLGYYYLSSEEYTTSDAYCRRFRTTGTYGSDTLGPNKHYSYGRAVCIGN